MRGAHLSTVNPQVWERGRWAGSPTDEDQGPGGSASELWVPTYPRAVETGGMAGEPQAGLQALLLGGAPHAAQETQTPLIQSAERDQASGSRPDDRWAMDFMSDELFDGRRIRLLTLVDHFTSESLATLVDGNLGGQRVVEVLARLALRGRKPKTISMDNGPEFTSKRMDQWAYLTVWSWTSADQASLQTTP